MPNASQPICKSIGFLSNFATDAGSAKVAGVELTLLDCARYFRKAAGINALAQVAKDIGAEADPRTLAMLAAAFENSSMRRLGYMLDHARHARQANALEPFVKKAKTAARLAPPRQPCDRLPSRVEREKCPMEARDQRICSSRSAQYAQRIAPYLLAPDGVDSENRRGHDPAGYGFA